MNCYQNVPTGSRLLLLMPVLLLVCAGSVLFSQEEAEQGTSQNQEKPEPTVEQLRETLQERTATLRRERADYHRSLRDLDEEIRETRRRRNLLRGEIEQLQSQRNTVRERTDRVREDIQQLRETAGRRMDRVETLHVSARNLARRLQRYMQQTPPARPDARTRTLQQMVSDLQSPDVGSGEVASLHDALASLQVLWEQEVSESLSTDSKTDLVRLPDGRQKHGTIARVGHVLSFYVSEDRQDIVLRMGPGEDRDDGKKTWRNVPDQNDSTFHQALDIMQGRARPARLLLPVDRRLIRVFPGDDTGNRPGTATPPAEEDQDSVSEQDQ